MAHHISHSASYYFTCRRDNAEVQTLYRQSAGHAAEQSQLIKQLEGLNLDTQKVLRNQEEAHSADTSSYQRVPAHLYTCGPSKLITVAIIVPSVVYSMTGYSSK